MTNVQPLGRFDYIQYDVQAQSIQARAKEICVVLEAHIERTIENGRAKSLALTKLEEVYMWVGKAIRDEQVKRRGAFLQEDRTDS